MYYLSRKTFGTTDWTLWIELQRFNNTFPTKHVTTFGTTFLFDLIVTNSTQLISLTLITQLIFRNGLSWNSFLVSLLLIAHFFILEKDNLFPQVYKEVDELDGQNCQ